MKKYLETIKRSKLVNHLSDDEIEGALTCLNYKIYKFQKGETIYSEGDVVRRVYIILNGEAEIRKSDYLGNINIISKFFASDLIGVSTPFSSEKRIPFDIIAISECELLALDINCITGPCSKSCSRHLNIIINLLEIISDRNIGLTEKINLLTKRSIRERLLAYLYAKSKEKNSKKFAITLTREQLADYLSVNRSALSREISNMKSEGILDFDKNIFWLK